MKSLGRSCSRFEIQNALDALGWIDSTRHSPIPGKQSNDASDMRNDWELKRIQVSGMHGCNYREFSCLVEWNFWCRKWAACFHCGNSILVSIISPVWRSIVTSTKRGRMHTSNGDPSANRFTERRKSGANYKLYHWLNVAPYMHRLQHFTQVRVKIIRRCYFSRFILALQQVQ